MYVSTKWAAKEGSAKKIDSYVSERKLESQC